MKTCTKCHQEKPRAEFYRDSQKSDGLSSHCAECKRTYTREWKASDPERARRLENESAAMRRAADPEAYRRAERERFARRKAADPDAIRAHRRHAARRYRARHPERVREAYQRWYESGGREHQARALMRRYRSDPTPFLARQHQRRALQNGAPGKCGAIELKARWDYYGGLCYLCGNPANSIDHVIPLTGGGSNWPANLRPACRSCNSAKGARPLREYNHAGAERQ